jgi:hypothetical protein
VNEDATLLKLQRAKPDDLVRDINTYVTSRARRFVWAQDTSQETFIDNTMSTKLEPKPLLPKIGRYAARDRNESAMNRCESPTA